MLPVVPVVPDGEPLLPDVPPVVLDPEVPPVVDPDWPLVPDPYVPEPEVPDEPMVDPLVPGLEPLVPLVPPVVEPLLEFEPVPRLASLPYRPLESFMFQRSPLSRSLREPELLRPE